MKLYGYVTNHLKDKQNAEKQRTRRRD
jgi:hypothetical protein